MCTVYSSWGDKFVILKYPLKWETTPTSGSFRPSDSKTNSSMFPGVHKTYLIRVFPSHISLEMRTFHRSSFISISHQSLTNRFEWKSAVLCILKWNVSISIWNLHISLWNARISIKINFWVLASSSSKAFLPKDKSDWFENLQHFTLWRQKNTRELPLVRVFRSALNTWKVRITNTSERKSTFEL